MNVQELIKENKERLINIIYEKELRIEELKADIDGAECEINDLEDDIMNYEEMLSQDSARLKIARQQLNDLLSKDFTGYSESQIIRFFFGEDNQTLKLFDEKEIALDEI